MIEGKHEKSSGFIGGYLFPQFIENDDKGLDLLMDSSSLVTFPAGQQLFYPGSRCENYLLVLAGVVKVQIMSDSGREMLLPCSFWRFVCFNNVLYVEWRLLPC